MDNGQGVEQQKIELLISQVVGTNVVNITGPIDNKMLCYSLLEMARDAIKDYGDRQTTLQEKKPKRWNRLLR